MNDTTAIEKSKANITGKEAGDAYKTLLQAKFDQLINDYDLYFGTDFDILEELFGDYDEIILSDIRHESSKNLKSFLEAGFDVNQIIKLLSCEEVWTQYDMLKSYGAKFRVLKRKVLDYLELQFEYGKDEAIIDEFVVFYKRGVGFTKLLSNIRVGYEGSPQRWQYDGPAYRKLREKMTYEGLLNEGVDASTANQLVEKYHKYMG